MKLNLTYGAVSLLKFVCNYTGEKEIQVVQGKEVEVPSPRRLNGEESSQRRHYNKALEGMNKEYEEFQAQINSHNQIANIKRKELEKETKRKKDETDDNYKSRINEILNEDKELKESFEVLKKTTEEFNAKKFEIELTDKTVEFVKKFYKKFGDDLGFAVVDDPVLEEIDSELLK